MLLLRRPFQLTAVLLLGLFPAVGLPAGAAETPAPVVPTGDPPSSLPVLENSPEIRRAVAATRAGEWDAAAKAWSEVVKQDPSNAGALSNLGKVQYQLQDFPAARISLENATSLKPELVDSWLTLGLVYLELDAPMMAVSAATRAVAENPSDPRSHNSLAIILKRIGWTTGAESELQKALDLDPAYAEAHFNLAVMYLERKPPSVEMAGRHYRKARTLGAAPDELVERQIRGESSLVEDSALAGDPEGGDSAPPSSPPRAVPVSEPAPPKRRK